MLTLKAPLWRHLLGRLPLNRMAREGAAKHVIPLLRPELLNDHLRRDLGLPGWQSDARLPRL